LTAHEAGARRPRRWRNRVMTWTGMLIVLASTAFLVGSRANGETPTAVPFPAIAEPQPPVPTTQTPERVNETAARTRPSRQSTGVATGTRRFVWPPAVGATGYHVELFKGSVLVFRDQTKKPQIVIRSHWRFNGRTRRFQPGAYRWYVWPLLGGQRDATAIVQAKLVVPR
jgi:hypothetical protein